MKGGGGEDGTQGGGRFPPFPLCRKYPVYYSTTNEHCNDVNIEILVGTIAIQSNISPESSLQPSLV